MRFNCPVFLSKDEISTLSDLAGPDLSITEYMRDILIKHIASITAVQADSPPLCEKCKSIGRNGEHSWYCRKCGEPLN